MKSNTHSTLISTKRVLFTCMVDKSNDGNDERLFCPKSKERQIRKYRKDSIPSNAISTVTAIKNDLIPSPPKPVPYKEQVLIDTYTSPSPGQPHTGICYDCMPPNPTGKALFRTLTINLGSISMGSMITSIIKTLRVILEGLRRSNDGNPSFTVIMAGFTLKWIECIARYFNSYAFTYIAIYGKNFTASAKKTWDLIQNCGLDAIINDDIIGGTIMFSACIVAALTGFCGAFWAVHSGIENWFWGVGFPCSLVGFVLGVVTFNVVESAVLSIYVCFAEDPDALYYNDRDLYEKLTDAQEMGVLADIDSESSTESDDTSLGDFTTSEDEEDMLDKDNFDDLTPEQ